MQSLGWWYIFPLVPLSRAPALAGEFLASEFFLSISAYNWGILICLSFPFLKAQNHISEITQDCEAAALSGNDVKTHSTWLLRCDQVFGVKQKDLYCLCCSVVEWKRKAG